MSLKNMEYINRNNSWFFFTLLYFIIDYSRPQEVIPIGPMRPALITVLILVFFILTNYKDDFVKSNQIKRIWYFILLIGCYVPFATNNFFAFTTFKALMLYMPFILSVIVCVDSMQRLKKIIFIGICLEVYIAIFAFFHNGKGPGNYFLDENDLSLYINMWLPFCYFLFSPEKKMKNRLVYATGLIIGLLSVVVSFSRGGFVGLLAMSVTARFFSKKKIASLLVISFMALMLLAFGSDKYWKEMSTVTDTSDSTANERILTWGAGWRMFLDNPLGVGGNNFQVRFPEYQSSEHSRNMWGRVAHSLWFTLIPETGIIGIYLYFSLLFYNLKDISYLKKFKINNNFSDDDSKYFNAMGCAFIASLAGYFSSATFVAVLYYAHYWYLTGFIIATVNIAKSMDISIKRAEGTPLYPQSGRIRMSTDGIEFK